MIATSPPMDAMLHMRGTVKESDLAYFGHLAYEKIMERGAKNMIHTIVTDCSTMGVECPMTRSREYQLDVVVLSRDRYTQLIDEAYKQGLADGRRV